VIITTTRNKKGTHMTDPSSYLDTDDAAAGPDRGSSAATHRTPRWVKVFGIIVLALVLVFVILQLTGVAPDHGGGH
jgi:hypothetical protein